jgi:hypothetical protein
MASDIDSARHWHMRAEEVRAMAEDMIDPVAKAIALRIAEDYERLVSRGTITEPGKTAAAAIGSSKPPSS